MNRVYFAFEYNIILFIPFVWLVGVCVLTADHHGHGRRITIKGVSSWADCRVFLVVLNIPQSATGTTFKHWDNVTLLRKVHKRLSLGGRIEV